MIDHELGYELRSADPTPYDMGYCRSLGYFAVELLSTANQPTAAMVSVVNGNLTPIDLHDMIDPKTNRTRSHGGSEVRLLPDCAGIHDPP